MSFVGDAGYRPAYGGDPPRCGGDSRQRGREQHHQGRAKVPFADLDKMARPMYKKEVARKFSVAGSIQPIHPLALENQFKQRPEFGSTACHDRQRGSTEASANAAKYLAWHGVSAMTERQYYDWLTEGGANDVTGMIHVLESVGVPWCMIGGLAVNHWAQEPMVTRDVDIVIALDRVEPVVDAFASAGFEVHKFPYSVNLQGRSQVSIQISTDEMYREFPGRGIPADIHGILMRVACLEDTLTGKLAAYADRGRRPSKRQKDLADIARLLESHPHLESRIPSELLSRIRD